MDKVEGKKILISNSKVFLFSCVAFILGVGLSSFLPQINSYEFILFSLCVFTAVLSILFWKKRFFRILILISLFLFLGLWRYAFDLNVFDNSDISFYNGKNIEYYGKICENPEISDKQKIVLCSDSVKINGLKKQVKGRVLIYLKRFPEYQYADKLKVVGQLDRAEEFNDFAFDRYLARYDIFSVSYYPEIKKIESKPDLKEKSFQKIILLRNKIIEKINFGMLEPEASLGRAIIIGDKKNIDQNLRDSFSKSGLSHIIAISGLHISIFSLTLLWFLFFLGFSRKSGILVISAILVFYIILIGAPPSAVRAGVMGFLAFLAIFLGRLNKSENALMFCALIMLLFNPKILRDDIGFQLSFLSVLGIVYFYPFLNNKMANIYKNYAFLKAPLSIISLTIAAQALIIPIIAINFKQISLISPLSNLLALWTLPFLLALGMGAIILSFFYSPLAPLFFAPTQFILKYLIFISDFLGSLPLASLKTESPPLIFIIIYYLTTIFLVYKIKKQSVN